MAKMTVIAKNCLIIIVTITIGVNQKQAGEGATVGFGDTYAEWRYN